MDLHDDLPRWRPGSQTIDMTTEVGNNRYNELRALNAAGTITKLTVTDGAYNQKEGCYIRLCQWWEPILEGNPEESDE